jgi:hypothetical protein
MAEKEESKKGEMEKRAIPLLTPHRMGNFNLSHRSVKFKPCT